MFRSVLISLLIVSACAASQPSQKPAKPPPPAPAASDHPKAPPDDKEARCERVLTAITDGLGNGVREVLAASTSREQAALGLVQLLPGSPRAQKLIAGVLEEQHVTDAELKQYLETHPESSKHFEERLEAISTAASASSKLPSLTQTPSGCEELLKLVVELRKEDQEAARGVSPLLTPCAGKVDERALRCALSEAGSENFAACVRGERNPSEGAGPPLGRADLPKPWQPSVAGVGHGKPALLIFCAGWAGACGKLQQRVLAQPDILRVLERDYIAVYVDATTDGDPEVKRNLQRFAIESAPTILILDSRGKEVSRTLDYLEPDALLRLLQKHAGKAGH